MPNFTVAQLPGISVAFEETNFLFKPQKSLRSSGLVAIAPRLATWKKTKHQHPDVASSGALR
jgi:hypothetical protein